VALRETKNTLKLYKLLKNVDIQISINCSDIIILNTNAYSIFRDKQENCFYQLDAYTC